MANGTDNVNPAPQIVDEPDPQISGQQAGQDFDQAGEKSATLAEIKEMIQTEVQSMKDVRLGKYGTRLDNLEDAIDTYESLKASGKSGDEAKARMQDAQELREIREELAAIRSGDAGTVSVGTGAEPWGVTQAKLLESAGLNENDPRAVELAKSRESWTTKEWLETLEQATLDWRNADLNKPQPSSASVAQMTPSIPSGDGDYTAASYGEAMLAASGNKAELNRIKAKARADGVDVDNIGFA